MSFMTGWKTYIAAIGLLATGVTKLIEGDYAEGVTIVMNALAAAGIRTAIEKK